LKCSASSVGNSRSALIQGDSVPFWVSDIFFQFNFKLSEDEENTKKKKVALLIGFTGTGYNGFVKQPTASWSP
jgi:hypothetical protein